MIHKHLMRQHEVLSYCEAVTNRTLFDTNKGVTIQMHDGHSLNQFLLNPRRFRIDDSVDFFWSELITAPIFSELRAATPYWKSSSNTCLSTLLICETRFPANDALIACFSSSVVYDSHETSPCTNRLKPNFLIHIKPLNEILKVNNPEYGTINCWPSHVFFGVQRTWQRSASSNCKESSSPMFSLSFFKSALRFRTSTFLKTICICHYLKLNNRRKKRMWQRSRESNWTASLKNLLVLFNRYLEFI